MPPCKTPIPTHIIFQMQKTKDNENISKEAREIKRPAYTRKRIIVTFSTETTQSRRKLDKIFKVLKEKNQHQFCCLYQLYHANTKQK